MKKPSMPAGTQATVRVWDAVVRFTHWSVAALVLWELVENSGGPLHRTLGYATAGLVLLRLLWGFVGSPPARFSAWLPSPSGALAYSRALLAGARAALSQPHAAGRPDDGDDVDTDPRSCRDRMAVPARRLLGRTGR